MGTPGQRLPMVSFPNPPDRGYGEHGAALGDLIGSTLHGIRVVTLGELRGSDDVREVEADLD